MWTSTLLSLQSVGTVEPGQELRETAFVLAWHEEEPALGHRLRLRRHAAGRDGKQCCGEPA